jgi:hypothetical protein
LIVVDTIALIGFLIVHHQNEVAQAERNYREAVDPTHETFSEKAEAEQAAFEKHQDYIHFMAGRTG